MSGRPRVSVIISTYNRRDRLERAVRPLLGDPGTHEVIVVVDGSRDGSFELLQRLAREDPRLKPMFVENRGETGARHAAAEHATGEVVLILDDDEVAEPGLVSGHALHHSEGRPLVVVGYTPIAEPERRTRENFATYVYRHHYENACLEYEREPSTVLRRLHGGHMSLRREDYLRVTRDWRDFVNGYHADMDLGLRCLAEGLTGVFDRGLVAWHEYDRPLRPFINDARGSGVNRSLVHWVHGDLIGQLPGDHYERGLPGPARAILRWSRRPRLRSVWGAVLWAAAVGFGYLRLFTLQTWSAQLLRRIEHERGAIEFARAVRSGRGPATRGRSA